MENPIYTFATPSLISKVYSKCSTGHQAETILTEPCQDRENVDVIAHELAHSWSGNLVTNASWEHFWLNEGWTTYLERRVSVHLYLRLISLANNGVVDYGCSVS